MMELTVDLTSGNIKYDHALAAWREYAQKKRTRKESRPDIIGANEHLLAFRPNHAMKKSEHTYNR